MTPLLLLRNDPAASAATRGYPMSAGSAARAPAPPARTGHGPAAGVDGRSAGSPGGPVALDASPVRHDAPTTTTTTTTSTTTAPPPSTTTTTPPPTTTTRPPPPPTTTTRPLPVGSGVHTSGIVTYYAHPAGRCASPWLPFGTVVTVTNPANGATVTCTVDDREADTARSIDLATASFAVIAPLWQGVVDARLSW
ncbi:MAG TPA: septal ring lytic transglycosylase RlpA family protein [Acidimicrobiales bacterium]|nr:septal ring lytic transglycosylase RlpA family protein [Acidimicrobiales bacterium]